MVLLSDAPYRAQVEGYLAGLDGVLRGAAVAGVYLLGSAALGDYQQGRSNLDLLVMMNRPPDPAEVEGLARLHEGLKTGAQPYLDATYLHVALLGTLDLVDARGIACVLNGDFYLGTAHQEVVIWATLALCGVTLRGHDARLLRTAPHPVMLVASNHRELEGLWRPFALETRRTTESLDGAALFPKEQVMTLGTQPGRLFWTILNGAIISKTRSLDFTADIFSDYAELLGRVKASRLGDESITFTVDDARAAADLVEVICDAAKMLP